MKVFLDTNILVAVLRNEVLNFTACVKVLNLYQHKNIELVTTNLTLGTAFYLTGKRFGDAEAKRKLHILSNAFSVIPCGQPEANDAFITAAVHDFEDGLQYFAALNSGCKFIITYNKADFYFSKIPVLLPDEFLAHLSALK